MFDNETQNSEINFISEQIYYYYKLIEDDGYEFLKYWTRRTSYDS